MKIPFQVNDEDMAIQKHNLKYCRRQKEAEIDIQAKARKYNMLIKPPFPKRVNVNKLIARIWQYKNIT